ncbi:putative protein OS=Afipia felis OX=1035 GN=BN961_04062 PE=4 SV=1 [Afipia felis]
MRQRLAVAILMLGLAPACAAEPAGCENFKWPVTRERALLTAPNLPNFNSGADASTLPPFAAILKLHPAANAGLPKPSERTQKPGTFAGYLRLGQVPGGVYTVSVSDFAWVDVIQDGNYLKPTAFSGVTGCNGIRKTMRFDLAPGPATVQISGVATNSIHLAVTLSSD